MFVTLIRHAPTHEKCCLGWRDVPADTSDELAFSKLNASLPEHFTCVSSDLKRATQTAYKLRNAAYISPPDPRLREFNFGAWDGLSFDEIEQRAPKLSRLFWDHAGDITAPNGESWNMVLKRSSEAITQACKAAQTPYLVIVTHLGVILTQIARAKQITPYQAMSHSVDYLSKTHFTYSQNKWKIDSSFMA